MRVLIKFRHGLGDAVQLTTVLLHLARHRPDWSIDVASLTGKHTAFWGLCRNSYRLDRDAIDPSAYARVFDLNWHECNEAYGNCPSTKAEHCLRTVFGITPSSELCHYKITPNPSALANATKYLEQIAGKPNANGRYPIASIHYQGNTSPQRKNLSHETAGRVCREVLRLGLVPVVLDWDHRSPLPDGRTIHCPDTHHPLWGQTGTGDADALAALIQQSSLTIGVDSGPQKVAGATDTPTLAVWTGNHPIHYFGLADHVTHLVPQDHAGLVRGQRELALGFFSKHYRFEVYRDICESLLQAISRAVETPPSGLVMQAGFWVRPDNVAQDRVIITDIYEQDSYRLFELPLPEETVVDIGAHIGTFAARYHQRNPQSRIVCVEACPENIPALKANVSRFAEVLFAACTYEQETVLLNAVRPQCRSTGGSRVLPRNEALAVDDPQYFLDDRPLPTITLEEIMDRCGLDRIDVLKLDCEGSEFSILENTSSLHRIGRIVGEYHGKDHFHKMVRQRFPDWTLRILHDGDPGTFWLTNGRRS